MEYEYSVENICGLLMRSKLLTPDEVKAMYQAWLGDARDASGDVGKFKDWLAARHYVTEYQAKLLVRGHADDFFLGQYKILDRIGRGRMAGVYKALHPLGQVVAIKVLPPSKAKDAKMLARFQRESQLAMRLKHPNVVRAFQLGEANGLHYLVMEYLDGETLDEVLQRRKKLPPAEAVRVMHQALLGLQHIHEQGLVHRDLKPSNLMLVPAPGSGQPDSTARATVKILDIGLGRALFDESSPAPPTGVGEQLQITAEGVLLGTPDYLSPEQARDPRTIDIRSDIYSLGCVLYHVLTGQPPFPDTNIISQMVRHATEAPKPLKAFNPAVPDGLQQIVDQMLAKDPAQRYPTPGKAAQALKAFLAAGSEPARAIEAEPQMRKYLTWLETDSKSDPPAPAPKPAAPPRSNSPAVTTKPKPPSTGTMPAAAPTFKQSSKKQKRKRSGHRSSRVKAGKAGDDNEFDVELVPAVPVRKNPSESPRSFGLTRRDWLLIGVGAGAVIAAGAAGLIIRWLTSDDEDE